MLRGRGRGQHCRCPRGCSVRLAEAGMGDAFVTRLTRRVGVVLAHTVERGVLVRWDDRAPDKYVHGELAVEAIPHAPESEEV